MIPVDHIFNLKRGDKLFLQELVDDRIISRPCYFWDYEELKNNEFGIVIVIERRKKMHEINYTQLNAPILAHKNLEFEKDMVYYDELQFEKCNAYQLYLEEEK